MKRTIIDISGVVVTVIITVMMLQYMGHRLDPKNSQSGLDAVKEIGRAHV